MSRLTVSYCVYALALGACSTESGTPQDVPVPVVGGAGDTASAMPVVVTPPPDTLAGTGGTTAVPPPVIAGTGGTAAGTGGAPLSAGMGGMGAGTDTIVEPPPAAILPPVDDVAGMGPFTPTIDKNTGPSGSAWVARPTELGADGLLHPMFLWGPGAGTGPSNYEAYLTRWASHGFVVYSIVSTGDGSEFVAAMDWLIAENDDPGSPYFGKLDVTRIAAGGHSRGSLSTFGAGDDPRLVTTIHVAGGSFDGNGANSLHAPAAYFCGELDTLATPNCERDYGATSVPVFFGVMSGIDHIAATNGSDAAIVAWLRWHLGGEEDRRRSFLDPSCEYCTGIWTTQSKNW